MRMIRPRVIPVCRFGINENFWKGVSEVGLHGRALWTGKRTLAHFGKNFVRSHEYYVAKKNMRKNIIFITAIKVLKRRTFLFSRWHFIF